MGTLGKRAMRQKKERICPLCDDVIPLYELTGRTKYHETCAAMLKRIKDITRLRYKFFIEHAAKRYFEPLTDYQRQGHFELILKETVDKVNEWAEGDVWLIGCVLAYYSKLFKSDHNDFWSLKK